MWFEQSIQNGLGDTPPPPPAVISQEEIDKQKDAAIRQLAARGQQMASKGAGPRAQVGAQMGQVRQPFKGGGGLRQMVQLPSNRVRFGKDAYQDGTPIYPEEEIETLTSPYVRDPQASPFMNFLGGIKYDTGSRYG